MNIDLRSTRTLVERALFDLERLDDVEVGLDIGAKARKGDSNVADVNRRLTFAVHTLRRAASEAEAEYFQLRGFPDLLDPQEGH